MMATAAARMAPASTERRHMSASLGNYYRLVVNDFFTTDLLHQVKHTSKTHVIKVSRPATSKRAKATNNEREAVAQIIAGAAVELDLSGDHAEAVVLDLVQPQLAGRRLRG